MMPPFLIVSGNAAIELTIGMHPPAIASAAEMQLWITIPLATKL